MARNQDFQVGPSMKPKVGSQGTLFRGNGPMSDRKWPRGYSPERLNAVKSAVGEVESFYPKPHTRQTVSNIARSTVPLHHLDGLQFRVADMRDKSTAGLYDPLHPSGTPQITVRVMEAQNQTPTLIHEIGHHADRESFPAYGEHNHGALEGFADQYAEEHYRSPKGKRGTVEGYRGLNGFDQLHPSFRGGYHQARSEAHEDWHPSPPLTVSQTRSQMNAEEDPRDPSHMHHQPGLF